MTGRPTLEALAARVRAARPTVGEVRLVLVDGPAGSGKTTVAAGLARLLDDAPVVHADELYEGWSVVAGCPDLPSAFGALAQRVTAWLLEPWAAGHPGAHPAWDWVADGWSAAPHPVPPAEVVVLEGVGMAARALRPRAVATVWVEHPDADERLRRVLARDGTALEDRMRTWQLAERDWFALDGTRDGCTDRLRT